MDKTQLRTSQLGGTGLEITPRFTEPQLTRHLALAARLRAVAGRHDVTPGAVAVAWVLRNPAVDGAITGFRRPEQVGPIVAAAGLELTGEDLSQIEASG
jgi:aryl-alcohol dehydrogenase-like predicted oxidoreductase